MPDTWYPNLFLHPEQFVINGAVGLSVTSVCVAARFYTRAAILDKVARDDWLVLAAWVAFAAHAAMFLAWGGIFLATIPTTWTEARFNITENILWFQNFVYAIGQILVKVSLAAFVLTLLNPSTMPRHRLFLLSSTCIFTLFTLTYAFVNLFQCGNPLVYDPNYICLNVPALRTVGVVSAAINAVMDWILVLTPIEPVWNSMMTIRAKTTVGLVLSLCISGSLISVARVPVIAATNWDMPIEDMPRLYPFYWLAFWENAVGLMAVSLVATRPLVQKVLGQSRTGTELAGTAEIGRLQTIPGTKQANDEEMVRPVVIAFKVNA
ncbi:Hypothetical protein D9617_6g094420 [Elsinoe fawcettii]|nr:Hypothetical protein D9617_6g094420 [Elsinoe fawcettii]